MTAARTAAPRVSVVVPCYNYGHYLPEAVGSALRQSGVTVEVIVVDDASTDGSADVARRLEREDERVRALVHRANRGHIATYNDGLAEATGDYIVLLSADDLLAPGSLQRSTQLLREHPSVGMVYGYAPPFSVRPPQQPRARTRFAVWAGEEWLARLCARGSNMVTNPEVILRRDVMDRLGGYDPAMPHSADMDLWMRAAALADVGRVNGPHQAYYRVHDANMHLTDFSGLLTDMRARAHTFDTFFAGPGVTLARRDALRTAAHRAIAREALRYAATARDTGGAVGGATVAELCDYAAMVWPEVRATRAWRRGEAAGDRPARGLAKAAGRAAEHTRSALLWRRWRRYGI